MHVAIASTFVKYKYAFMILESYVIRHIECFYLIDPHGRNVVGMPDPNGTAVVMQFANVLDVEQYLYALFDAMHSNLFEIVPVQFTEFVSNGSPKNVNFTRSVRLLKNREFQSTKWSKENDCERQNRLLDSREYVNKKRCEESELARQSKLDCANMLKGSDQLRLIWRDKTGLKRRLYQRSASSQNDYLTAFNISENGGIEEQSWAKTNVNKFHKSIKYVVSQCTVCLEA